MYRAGIGFKGRKLVIIHAGEYLATGEDIVISTVLGSCISVALFDPAGSGGGLNHFMLPGAMHERMERDSNAKYGMYAMDLLVNDLMRLGVKRSTLVAKVFGGASVIKTATKVNQVPRSNIEFAMEYLRKENISVAASDVGGTLPRKIYLYPDSGRVLLKRIQSESSASIDREEREYLEDIRKKPSGEVVLF